MAKRAKRIRFTVEGSGEFPFDMLRYDQCWPEKESRDSYLLGLSFNTGGDEYLNKRQVTLLSDNQHAPTVGRWNSFTWKVINTESVV